MSQAAADDLVTEGDELFRTERFDEAVARFERAVSVFPHHALGWKGLGHSLLLMGKPHEAARALDQAIGLKPDSATALWAGALAHAEIGNKVVAKDYLRRSIALQPTWVTMAATTPQFANLLRISTRAADKLHAAFGPFSTRRYHHSLDESRFIEIGRMPNMPDVGRFTFVTVGFANVEWNEPERPRIELIMASTVDSESCSQILANLAFHLADNRFFPEPGTMVRDVVAALDAGELSARLPHVYVQSPKLWGVELPIDVGPPAITLAQVFPISDAEYQQWRSVDSQQFEQELVAANIDVTDLRRRG